MDSIAFQASVYKVQTLVDGGIRLTLDLPETAIPQMAMLAECHRLGVVLSMTAEAANLPKAAGIYSHYKKDG